MSEMSLEDRIGRMEDVWAIQQLKYKYARYCDDGYDAEGIASLFVEDGRWIVDGVGGTNEGREAIRAHFQALPEAIPWALHHVIAPQIEVSDDGQSAHGEFYMIAFCTIKRTDDPSEEDAVVITLTYIDEFVKRDGRWMFQELKGKTHQASNWTEGWVNQPMRP